MWGAVCGGQKGAETDPLAVLGLGVLLRQAIGAREAGDHVALVEPRGDPRVLKPSSGRHRNSMWVTAV